MMKGAETQSLPITDAIETCRCLHLSRRITITKIFCWNVKLSTTYPHLSDISLLMLPLYGLNGSAVSVFRESVANKQPMIEHLPQCANACNLHTLRFR